MKKIATLILFVTVSCIAVSQEKQLEYTAEFPVENTTAKELHDRCRDWFSRNFNHPNKVHIESTDDKIIALPHLLYYPNFIWGSDPIKGTITYTFEVDLSDGKFTYIINNFVHHGNPDAFVRPISFGLITMASKSPDKSRNQVFAQMAWNDIKSQIREQMTTLIENLKDEMTTDKKNGTTDKKEE